MKRFALGVLFSLLGAGGTASAQLNEIQVIQAIQAGESGKFQSLLSTCLATPGFGDFMTSSGSSGGSRRDGDYTVATSSSEGRIATLASIGKKMYKPLTPA